ncbi:MAG: NAD(P)H-dependent oxidoreductase [Bacteroidetes bacterium]|nr:NAD(P)H-dependent oxidoreductase [Bacteroidota bacterium]
MYLIIYAHPDSKSFNYAMLKQVMSTLARKNIPYKVIDLYGINYNPVLSLEELKGKISEQTIEFQKMIKKATNIIFIFPVWWFRAPAILEGFCDKVFTVGFAYHYKHLFGVYGMPIRHLTDKRVTAFITHGAPAFPVKTIYVNAVKYRFILGFLSFCFNIFKCKIVQFWSVPFVGEEKRKNYLKKIVSVISNL